MLYNFSIYAVQFNIILYKLRFRKITVGDKPTYVYVVDELYFIHAVILLHLQYWTYILGFILFVKQDFNFKIISLI